MGRPRIHKDNAARQRAYRERLKARDTVAVTENEREAEQPPVPVTQSEGKPSIKEFLK